MPPSECGVFKISRAHARTMVKRKHPMTDLTDEDKDDGEPTAQRAMLFAQPGRLNIDLHVAVAQQRPKKVRAIIDAGADVNSQWIEGRTPLHLTAEVGRNLEIVRYLIEAGADLNAEVPYTRDPHLDPGGVTPLHVSAQYGNLEMMRYLIEKGADMNSKDQNGRTPLHASADEGHLKVVKYLFRKGADVNSKCNDGESPLDNSIYWGHLKVAKYLMKKGANLAGYSSERIADLISQGRRRRKLERPRRLGEI